MQILYDSTKSIIDLLYHSLLSDPLDSSFLLSLDFIYKLFCTEYDYTLVHIPLLVLGLAFISPISDLSINVFYLDDLRDIPLYLYSNLT